MPRPPVGTTGASLSRFWAVSGPGGGRTQPRPIAVLQPFLGARAPVHKQPNICATEGAPGVPASMVVEYIHPMSAVPTILVLAVSEPFLSRFSSRFSGFRPILTRFSLFRATGNLPKAPHVPSDGVREALGMHLGRPRPWAGRGKGIRLKISRAPHHTPIADLQRFRRRGPPWSQKKRYFPAQSTPSRVAP